MLLQMAGLSFCDQIILDLYIYHILFILSSNDGHEGCCHVLAIVNKVKTNMPMPSL